jgi:hypothetical protein
VKHFMARRWLVSALAVLPVAVVFLAAGSPASAASDPPFVGWSAVLPPLASEYQPNSSDDCIAGRVACVRRTIAAMQSRYDPLASSCDHAAVFALAYLRTTQTYLDSTSTAGYFADPAFVNHEDAAFAAMYFSAMDDWTAGRRDHVPPAWRIALQAGQDRSENGIGDLLLGMNAHVNRDLPFVLAAVGLVAPDGTSRKPDHDKIDVMLNHVVQPLIAEEAARFDPGIEPVRTPYGVGYTGLMQLLIAWRESAWRAAEQLVSAPDATSRARVAANIEASAAQQAQAIRASSAYLTPISSAAARDQNCADHSSTP